MSKCQVKTVRNPVYKNERTNVRDVKLRGLFANQGLRFTSQFIFIVSIRVKSFGIHFLSINLKKYKIIYI